MNLARSIAHVRNRYSQDHRDARRNPWFLAWIGLVAVFVSVNAAFIVAAMVTSPGLVTQDYYEQGRAYEQHALTRHAAQNRLGWEARLELPQLPVVNAPGTYRVSVVDARGVPLADAAVHITAYRPSDAGADFAAPLTPRAPGQYEGELRFDLPGTWDLTLTIARGADEYQQSQRISVRAP